MNAVLKTWMERVNAGDLESVLDLYDESATLLPTFSPQNATTKAAIKAYFENLASKAALSVTFHPETVIVNQIDKTVECISGNYTFAYENQGKLQSFASRFTFVIHTAKDHPIIHHHSSQIPQLHRK